MTSSFVTASPAVAGVTHHTAEVNGTTLHYVSAGDTGSPILLVHGWPESWWAFRDVIPLLAATHRVFAVDLRGFGDSGIADGDHDLATMAEDLHRLVAHLGVGPVHVTCQDISGGPVFAFAATHPGDVLSFTGVETTLPGVRLGDAGRREERRLLARGIPGRPGNSGAVPGRPRASDARLGRLGDDDGPGRGHRGRPRRVRPHLRAAGRLARHRGALPFLPDRRRPDAGTGRVAAADRSRARRRRHQRSLHRADDAPGRRRRHRGHDPGRRAFRRAGGARRLRHRGRRLRRPRRPEPLNGRVPAPPPSVPSPACR
ncbi:alpha/beta fold hydrolase [Streptomyces goshikiensis]|uniref:alpha/beta fold hydrolase n=1 Tax=Streptomyces goshikiensis TaxID=1942 RepID=UPI00368BC0E9